MSRNGPGSIVPGRRPVRVLLADGDLPVRAGVRLSLEGRGFEICAEAEDRARAVERALEERPDVCLLEVSLPGGGIAAAAEISAHLPGAAVIMLTSSRDDKDLFASLRAGASGYLLKETSFERLPHAIRGVVCGEAAIPRKLVARLVDELRGEGHRVRLSEEKGVELTRREWEVLALLRAGHRTAEIAGRLGISAVTVRRHASAAARKLGVADRASAVGLLEGSVGRSSA